LGICDEVAAALSKDGDVASASLDSLNCHEPFRIPEDSFSDSSAEECAGLKLVSITSVELEGGVNDHGLKEGAKEISRFWMITKAYGSYNGSLCTRAIDYYYYIR